MANKKGHSTHLKVPAVRRTKIDRSKPSRECHASVSDCVKFLDFTISYLGVDQRHVQKSGCISVIHQTPGCLDAGCGDGVAVDIC